MGTIDPGTKFCGGCGAPLPPGRGVCPECGYVSTWFKVRFLVGCFFALLAIAGVGAMVLISIFGAR